jgi:dihydroorotate dehydrogenase (NAD+) catalytic subunit
VDLSTVLGGLHLPNPVVAASGTYGHADEVARLGDPSRIGAVTAKSLSVFPWPGNPPPRVHETTGGMINSIGLQNPGAAAWLEHDLPVLRDRGARVIASIWGRSIDDYAKAAAVLAPAAMTDHIVALEVNVSCPNLEDRGAVFGHSPDPTGAVLRTVVEQMPPGFPIFAKLSPNVTDLRPIAAAAVEAGATGLTLINTLMGLAIDPERRRPRLGGIGGGLSGPAIKPVALRAVWEVTNSLPGVPVIGTGGVATGRDAVEMLLAGASAVGVGTATFFDPRAPERIAAGIARWCADHGVTRLADLVGALE